MRKTRLLSFCANGSLPAMRAALTDFEQLPAAGVSASIAMTLVLTLTPLVCLGQTAAVLRLRLRSNGSSLVSMIEFGRSRQWN
jgi:hypothetical protein